MTTIESSSRLVQSVRALARWLRESSRRVQSAAMRGLPASRGDGDAVFGAPTQPPPAPRLEGGRDCRFRRACLTHRVAAARHLLDSSAKLAVAFGHGGQMSNGSLSAAIPMSSALRQPCSPGTLTRPSAMARKAHSRLRSEASTVPAPKAAIACGAASEVNVAVNLAFGARPAGSPKASRWCDPRAVGFHDHVAPQGCHSFMPLRGS